MSAPEGTALARLAHETFPDARRGLGLRLMRMFALIHSLENDPDPATVPRLAALAHLTEIGVNRLAKRLVARGLIAWARTPGTGSGQLSVANTERAKALAHALAQGR